MGFINYLFQHFGHQLKIHNIAVHEGKKPHKCSICDYSFTTEGNLNNHIDTIHGGFNNYLDCSVFSKVILRLWSCSLILTT